MSATVDPNSGDAATPVGVEGSEDYNPQTKKNYLQALITHGVYPARFWTPWGPLPFLSFLSLPLRMEIFIVGLFCHCVLGAHPYGHPVFST
jgi:hypothetical protein